MSLPQHHIKAESAIYRGTLRHRRFEPVGHEFSYGIFMAFMDIDRIPELMKISPFASYNRFNWATFAERDHFGDASQILRQRLTSDAAEQGIALDGGPVFLLTHLRYLGYNFNPISLFYCYGRDGRLQTVLAEVNSTFGESHNYWLTEANRTSGDQRHSYRCQKEMHVSPFMGMNLDYTFALTQPGETLVAHMETVEHVENNAGGHSFFDATLSLRRYPWSASALHGALIAHPWMTAKVIYAIHWQALRLYLKKAPVYSYVANR